MPWYRVPLNMTDRTNDPRLKALYEARSDAFPLAGGAMHIHLGSRGNRNAPRPCAVCGWVSERLCDWKMPNGRDCDRPLCAWCTTSPAPEKDLCPEHALRYKAWLAARTNSTDGAGP